MKNLYGLGQYQPEPLKEGRSLFITGRKHLQGSKLPNFLDCRISAYPGYVEFKGINRQPPNFIFVDLDRSGFKTEMAHRSALSFTLKNIKEKLGGNPTVLWSGNGYHIYQPVEAFVLEQLEGFSKFEQPSSKLFLRFAEWHLSNGKSDSAHNTTVSFKNCMLRIPGSHNSKCVQKNNVLDESITGVKIMQRWNGHRPKINLLLGSFYAYLVDQKFKEERKGKEVIEQRRKKQLFSKYSTIVGLVTTLLLIFHG